MKQLVLSALVALTLPLGVSAAQPGPPRSTVPGYLAPDALDIMSVLPAAPKPGDARDRADRDIFRATRAFEGTPRWQRASDDARASPAELYRDFACALDLAIIPERAPRLTQLLQRATRDAGRAIEASKSHYQRLRPYNVDTGPTCRPREETGQSFDYPSGHALVGWTWAQILAELDAAHAGPVLARGRAYGESRIVCGVHNYSAVQAGQLAASALVAALHASAEFRADLDAARAELAGLRAAGTSGPSAGGSAPPFGGPDTAAPPRACAAEGPLVSPLTVAPPAG
jgi:acid phosphatase (class A)